MSKRALSGIMLTLLLASMLTLGFKIHPVRARIVWFEWIDPAYYGYDPFFGRVIVAYQSGSVAQIDIRVFNEMFVTINVSGVKLGFDWGINYSSTEVSSQNPYTLMYNENYTFRVSFTVPSTSIASTTVLHAYTIWVEYVVVSTLHSDFWLASANDFSVVPPPLSASISPISASIAVGQSVTFTSTVSGGYTPYSYQWYLNGNPVSDAASDTWAFTPTVSGIYYVHLEVTDAKGNTSQSETARITVTAIPVGGYSIPIQKPATAKLLPIYTVLTAALTIAFTTTKRKTTKNKREGRKRSGFRCGPGGI